MSYGEVCYFTFEHHLDYIMKMNYLVLFMLSHFSSILFKILRKPISSNSLFYEKWKNFNTLRFRSHRILSHFNQFNSNSDSISIPFCDHTKHYFYFIKKNILPFLKKELYLFDSNNMEISTENDT